eukprot:Transcript_1385.p1 GENE.Transcript_1385~~Transcript_1385.p1  ORF type:complete len:355 (+),score=70.39 Transcript_1385:122-1186(+)
MPARVAVEPKVRSSTIAPAETPGHREFKHSSSRPAAAAVVHQINKARTSWFANLVPYLLSLRPSLVLVNGAVLYTCLCALFAGIYFGLGEACFATDEEFTFAETFWLSVHTFTTVGYGSIYPTCTSGQLVVMFESYISLVVTSVMGGRILFEVMRPRSRVRFSNVMLLDQSECGKPVLTFRMARECGSLLRDAKIQVQARFVWRDASGSTQGRRETLTMRSSEFSQLEQWQVYHSIDEASPLFPLLGQLNTQLTGLEVSLVAFDTSYMQEVRLYVTYNTKDLVLNAKFVDMISVRDNKGTREVTIDHAKLDLYTLHSATPKIKKRSLSIGRELTRRLRLASSRASLRRQRTANG